MRGSQGGVTNGSTIAENAGHGSPITIDENTITGNHGDGVMGYIGTTLVLHGNVIRGNGKSGVVCMENCLAQISRETIENNWGNGITLLWGAKLILEEPATTVSGNRDYALWCGDSESSFMAMDPLDTTDPILCTDFNH